MSDTSTLQRVQSSAAPPAPVRPGGLSPKQAAYELGYEEPSFRNKISRREVVVEHAGRNVLVYREDNEKLWETRRALGKLREPFKEDA